MKEKLMQELEKRNGVFQLKPSWVQRTFLPPGMRLKVRPEEVFKAGARYGGVSERWLSSTGMADNGDTTLDNEGLSFIVVNDGEALITLKDAIEVMGDEILGESIMKEFGCLRSFAKFYDFKVPIPLHVHLSEEVSQKVGAHSKPEAYYFPSQLNTIDYNAAHTYLGFNPGTSKEDIIERLANWDTYGDNGMLEVSKAYRLKLGTGWNIPAGILHAPGSLVTYEPQKVSDTSSFWQSMTSGYYMEHGLMTKFYEEDKKDDLEYIASAIDWEVNLDPNFKENHYCEPIMVSDKDEMFEAGYEEKWIVYGSDEFSAKELKVYPGKTVVIKDAAAYGLIMMEGYGTINDMSIETPAMIGYDDITADEMFVCYNAANKGVEITNLSKTSSIVMLKHFGPKNPDADKFIK